MMWSPFPDDGIRLFRIRSLLSCTKWMNQQSFGTFCVVNRAAWSLLGYRRIRRYAPLLPDVHTVRRIIRIGLLLVNQEVGS